MAGVNKVIIIGNLGKDPEVRYTPNGQAVANFNLATSDSWTDKQGQRQERTEWHRIVAWGKTAELCGEYLSKGRQVYVEGRLQTREWNDKENNKRYTTEVVCNNVTFLGGRGEGAGQSAQGGGGNFGGQSSGGGNFSGGQRRGGQGAPQSQGGGDQDMGYEYGPPPSDDDVPF